jgi:hypothetical protein
VQSKNTKLSTIANHRMPSMSVSHGGILYYVVKIPRSEFEAMSPDSEKSVGGGTTPIIKIDRLVLGN